MTDMNNIKWYMTEDVAAALRSRQIGIDKSRDKLTGATINEATNSAPYRVMQRAYKAAFAAGKVAEKLGVPHAVVADRLGYHARPEMIVAVVTGVPYEWAGTRQIASAEKAVDEIEMAFGPVRRRVSVDA
jgi:hypothetical protein